MKVRNLKHLENFIVDRPTLKQLIFSFADACAKEEGFFDRRGTMGHPFTIPQRLHNPLDLRTWKDAAGNPYEELNGYVNFPVCEIVDCKNPDHPAEIGWRAGRAQCSINIAKRGLTFREFFAGKPGVYAGFAPSRDKGNRPEEYADAVLDHVRQEFGFGPEVTIDTVILSLASDPPKIAAAVLPVKKAA